MSALKWKRQLEQYAMYSIVLKCQSHNYIHGYFTQRDSIFMTHATLSMSCLFLANGIIDILFKPRLEKSFSSYIDKVPNECKVSAFR